MAGTIATCKAGFQPNRGAGPQPSPSLDNYWTPAQLLHMTWAAPEPSTQGQGGNQGALIPVSY